MSPIIASPVQLHIPDGFLSVGIAIFCWLIAGIFIFVAVRKAEKRFDERLVPLAGIMAAFIFAGQMINFPVVSGVSGHLIGSALAVITLGPLAWHFSDDCRRQLVASTHLSRWWFIGNGC